MISSLHKHQQRNVFRRANDEFDWLFRLPEKWRDAVDAPLYFRHYQEYEITAQRTVGYDEDNRPCFVAHEVILTRPSSDDDEEYYETVTYREDMNAWRLHDGRWLVLRNTQATPRTQNGVFYAIHQDMPR
jgi:hypothetical protein